MQLTQFTDYALRILLFLGHQPTVAVSDGSATGGPESERLPAVLDIGRAYGISIHHLSKVAQRLGQLGFIVTSRGRTGGLRLARPPSEIRLGDLVRATEQLNLVECFDPVKNTCPINGACELKRVLREASQQFLHTLDRYTLADVMSQRQELVQLWGKGRSSQPGLGQPGLGQPGSGQPGPAHTDRAPRRANKPLRVRSTA
jgi:Rrf2 family nitric oxide-sensitive transcriptional repressor